ncbi:hypothetical protein UPYG_G00021210 [Umbra pygmaea]|uniref:Ig-like domain-containing protein n=1 Tax=Umbra pygmaea TaxID=75934 RepID=A0ABD0XNC9_UMBPY
MSQAHYTYLYILLIFLPKGLSQLVKTQRVVTVTLGETAHFSCMLLQPKDVLQVTWQKETSGGIENVATYNKRFGPVVNLPFQGKVAFQDEGLKNCSVIIRRVTREDESCYRCLFNAYPDGAISGRTCLQVIELYGPKVTQSNDTHNSSEFTLSCSATGRPAPIVVWDIRNHLALDYSPMVNITHPNGTVTVTISSTVAVPSLPDHSTVFGCVVSSGSVNQAVYMEIPGQHKVVDSGWIHGKGQHKVVDSVWIYGKGISDFAGMTLVGVIITVCGIVCWFKQRHPKSRENKIEHNTMRLKSEGFSPH